MKRIGVKSGWVNIVAVAFGVFIAGLAGAEEGKSVTSGLVGSDMPGVRQSKPVAVINARVHTVSGGVGGGAIENGAVVFADGKITAVGKMGEVVVPEGADVVDAAGKRVYPGLFDANTDIGLVEVNAVRATRDSTETGRINPNAVAAVTTDADSDHIYISRSNGILLVLSLPSGGILSGQASVLQLDGWTWEDLALQQRAGAVINVPEMSPQRGWDITESEKEQLKERDRRLAVLRGALDDAKAYMAKRDADGSMPIDARWEAMREVLAGKKPVLMRADTAEQIRAGLALAKEYGLKPVILGGYDAAECAPEIIECGGGVIIGGVHRLPLRRHDPYDHPFTLAARLKAASVPFAIASNHGAARVRNLPYHAGMAAGYGLTADEAVRAITLSPAELLGVAEKVGSIEVGKDATLIITDGDVLQTPTQVVGAYVQGRKLDLSNRHTRLAEKYREKYRRLEAGR